MGGQWPPRQARPKMKRKSKNRRAGQQLAECERKAAMLDEAVEWMTGRLDNEKLMRQYAIITRTAEKR